MKTLSLLSITLVFLSLSTKIIAAEPKTCTSKKIQVMGESKHLQPSSDQNSKKRFEVVRQVIPLGNSHSANGHEWRKLYLQLPPRYRKDLPKISVVIALKSESFPEKQMSEVFQLGSIEDGFYPIQNVLFSDLLGGSTEGFASSRLIFDVQLNGQNICRHQLQLLGGD